MKTKTYFFIGISVYLISLSASYFYQYITKKTQQIPFKTSELQICNNGIISNKSFELPFWTAPPIVNDSMNSISIIILLNHIPTTNYLTAFLNHLNEQSPNINIIAPIFNTTTTPEVNYYDNISCYMEQIRSKYAPNPYHVIAINDGINSSLSLLKSMPKNIKSTIWVSPDIIGSLNFYDSYETIISNLSFFKYIVPHFGLLSINSYQAPSLPPDISQNIISFFQEIQPPVTILHGKNDFITPLYIVEEYHRLIAQSELIVLDSDHSLIQKKPLDVAQLVINFIKNVENKEAITYKNATQERINLSKIVYNTDNVKAIQGTILYLTMLILILGTLINEDLTCIIAGIIAAHGIIDITTAIMSCLLGIFIGDIGLFFIGHLMGKNILYTFPFKFFIKPSNISNTKKWLHKKGLWLIFLCRFIPGTRVPVYITMGILGTHITKTILYFIISIVIWTPLIVGIAYLMGQQILPWIIDNKHTTLFLLFIIALTLFILVKILFHLFNKERRYILKSAVVRYTQWQHWPDVVFYFPAIIYALFIGLYYRKLVAFMAANRKLPYGGFAYSLKNDILKRIKHKEYVAPYTMIYRSYSYQKRIEIANTFIDKHQVNYPIVLKPNLGDQGRGVEIIYTYKTLKEKLKTLKEDHLLQLYITGKEYGVFYYRMPYQKQGHIVSITEKDLFSVIGNGKDTLQELIYKTKRLLPYLNYLFEKHKDHLSNVLDINEHYNVIELGSHARGSSFKDVSHLKTDALQKKIDNITQDIEGFYIGRYDLKVPSTKDLQQGKNISILELNGVDALDTHIFDPKYNWWYALKSMYKQTLLAYKIGIYNTKHGTLSPKLYHVLRPIMKYWKGIYKA